MQALTEREASVLTAIIHAHTEFAEPVGSRTIARQYLTDLSPATIRNTMMDLEELGLLASPHTSAGREPTVVGYRLYLNSLMEPPRLNTADRRLLDRVLTERERISSRDADTVLMHIARALANVSHLISVAFLPSFDSAVLERIELVPLAENCVLVVLQVRSGPVHTLTLEMTEPVKGNLLAETTSVLNERLSGHTIGEIRRTIGERLSGVSKGDRQVIKVFLREGENIFDLDARTNVILEGRLNIFQQPEFADHERLVEFMRLLDDRPLIQELRRRGSARNVQVSVGSENTIRELSTCSLLTRGYRVGLLSGTLAIVGPMRMPYRRLVAVLEHAGQVVETLMRS